MHVETNTIGKTVGAATAGLLGSLALLGMLFAQEGPKVAHPPVADVAEAEVPPRVGMLVFEKTPVGEVLLEKPDHGGGIRPVLPAKKTALSVKVTNDGERPFERLSLLVVRADGSVSWVMKDAAAPTGVDVALPVVAEVGPAAGRYAVLALFARRGLTDGDTARPLAQLRKQRAKGRLLVPGFGSAEVAEVRLEVEVQ